MTLRIYAREMARRDGERERLKALVEGIRLAPTGTRDDFEPSKAPVATKAEEEKTPN